ncbi:unnamed protein product [Arctia plantaginis]|uniref:Cilia- and flagella-associated protein 157 n=1 Tax=Arctia plantaginis TaxID=874455 RepID=A0A8S1B9W8_ARCPL|nr:unnamed protein product [Arctia plantaginis]
MAPKKDKAKKEDDKAGAFSEVERTFLEQQVAECNRKIARLRSALDEYETRNEELQSAYEKLDEDRADIIAYLKKVLNVKNEENCELKEKVKGLEEIRDIESAQFHEKVDELEKNFTIMKDQLTSENKLLAGKLNTLEEFRAIRDDLMKKFEKQEKDFEDQEMKYKRIIYDAEKKFVIGKDKLKKEMEARLLQLAQDFQDATELRVAASTHRVIRENIAISNELNTILSTQQKISDQNEMYKESTRSAIITKQLAEEERDKAINKNIVQRKVIDKLTSAFESIKVEKQIFEKKSYDFESLQAKIQNLTKENENLTLRIRILEQNLHVKLTDQNKAVVNASNITKERDKYRDILQEAAIAIQAALKLDQWAQTKHEERVTDRQLLLSNLLQIVSQFREIRESESMNTLASFTKVYDEGDLGFVPKSAPKKKLSGSSTLSTMPCFQTQQELLRKESKRSVITTSLSVGSVNSSIRTSPSIQILPEISHDNMLESKDSVKSFITSKESTSVEEESEIDQKNLSDVEKLLEDSKLAIQRSILKDLALSQQEFKKSSLSLARATSMPSITMLTKKSVTIMDRAQDVTKSNIATNNESNTATNISSEEQKDDDVTKDDEESVVSIDLNVETEVPEELSKQQAGEDKPE